MSKHKHNKMQAKIHRRLLLCTLVAIVSLVFAVILGDITYNHLWHTILDFGLVVPADKILDYLVFKGE